MTAFQNLMLSVCFGAILGYFVGNVLFMITDAWAGRRKRKRAEGQDPENG